MIDPRSSVWSALPGLHQAFAVPGLVTRATGELVSYIHIPMEKHFSGVIPLKSEGEYDRTATWLGSERDYLEMGLRYHRPVKC